MAFTEKEIAQAIKTSYVLRRIWLPQMRIGVGFGADAEQYIDLWGISVEKKDAYARTGIEIKVSRADFTRELRKPRKRQWIEVHCNEHYFAAPEGLLAYDDLPYGWGLIEVTDKPNGLRCKIAHKCVWCETNRPTWRFVASLARRLQANELGVGAK